MTRIFLFLVLTTLTFQACSQTSSTTPAKPQAQTKPQAQAQPQPQAQAQPQAQPVAYAATKPGWLVDLDEAYAVSIKEKKPILANFTGSDWCGWCKRLDADVFSKPEFKTWAEKNVVLLELDFPRRFQIPQKNRQQNAAMQQALQISGYPTIWVLNLTKNPDNGQYNINPLGKTGYTPTPQQFISVVDKYIHP